MEFSVLKDIVIIFAFSSLVNYLFTRIKVPTIIGYLLTGVIVGPKLLGIIKAPQEIELMAEIGVVSVALHDRNGVLAEPSFQNSPQGIFRWVSPTIINNISHNFSGSCI